MEIPTSPDHAAVAYDASAAFYDDFTAHHDYDGWIRALERLALEHGLAGPRLLDGAVCALRAVTARPVERRAPSPPRARDSTTSRRT
jgi:hypothetical protein